MRLQDVHKRVQMTTEVSCLNRNTSIWGCMQNDLDEESDQLILTLVNEESLKDTNL